MASPPPIVTEAVLISGPSGSGKTRRRLPKTVLKRLGLDRPSVLLVEVTPDGGILLRPAGVYPIEVYSEDRIREFLGEDRMTPPEARRIRRRTRAAS